MGRLLSGRSGLRGLDDVPLPVLALDAHFLVNVESDHILLDGPVETDQLLLKLIELGSKPVDVSSDCLILS